MWRSLYLLPIVLALGAGAARADDEDRSPPITSAASVASAKDDQPVQLRGRIVSRQSRNHYLFADDSGNALVKISRRVRNGSPLLPGMEVEIRGETDTRVSGPTRVEAKSVTVMAGNGWTNRAATPEPRPEPAKP
jgi:uncharacterized protein (TIGR00156 family)